MRSEVETRGEGRKFDDLLADGTPTTTDTPICPTDTTDPDEEHAVRGAGYWVAGILAVLGLTVAFIWGAVGTTNALDRVDSFDRTAIQVP